jgi:transcription elongation GreA/GreB family factor
MLMRRQAELEQMLAAVNPTDFADYLTNAVGPATSVRLRFEDGSEEQYVILGVWDQDDELHIISNETKLALALAGHTAGDEVEIPGEHGDRMCTLVEVTGLTDTIRAWIKAEPALVS